MRSTSLTFRQAINAQETPEAVLVLLTLDNDDLDEPIRVTSDAVNTVSNGHTFLACPFKINLPDDTDEHVTAAKLTIQVVLGSDPDTIEAEFDEFLLKNVTYDLLAVSRTLSIDHLMLEPVPGDVMDPHRFPGLF